MRNYFFDKGWLQSVSFDIPVIAVGNLSVGGTGKTPMIEYLVRLLQDDLKVAILSRGYGRRTKGFILAEKGAHAQQIGDEPYQYFKKFEQVQVAVDEDRVHGVTRLLNDKNPPEVILLDDAFQHRSIQAGFYILMTTYGKLYSDDFVLPTGDLREPRSGAERADIIVVSKCPENLIEAEKNSIRDRLNVKRDQEVFFTGIAYTENAIGENGVLSLKELRSCGVLLVTGIANPIPLVEYLNEMEIGFEHLKFADHHQISSKEMKRIEASLNALPGNNNVVLTTEKDFVRSFETSKLLIYYLPIQTRFLGGEEEFNQITLDYVRKNQGNG